MSQFKTIRRYVESALFNYPTIFHNRMSVLEHMFCVSGNGVDLDVAGFIIVDMIHPDTRTEEEQREYIMDQQLSLYQSLHGTEDGKQAVLDNVEMSLTWRERYVDESLHIKFYPTSKYNFVPDKMIGCKCIDFEEQVRWFVHALNSIDGSSVDGALEKDAHLDEYMRNVANWQQCSDQILKILEK